MPNTIAIGQPDKVSAAERDNKQVNEIFAKLKFGDEKVIEFDPPKGYSAKDAYYSAVCHFEGMDVPKERVRGRYIGFFRFQHIVGVDMQKWWKLSKEDRTNFYLLLAYANGFKD